MGGARTVHVVGAGIAGASVADHLARLTDAEVTLLERGASPATETTAKSGAFVGFWGHESATAVPLLRYGVRYYRDLLSAPDTDARFVHGGRLRVATTEAGDDVLRDSFSADLATRVEGETATAAEGAPVQYLTGDALASTLVLPGFDTDAVTGAIYSPGVGYVDDPAALTRALLDRAREHGATVETGVAVTGFETAGGRVVEVDVEGERRATDAVVCAAGPWNRRLLASAGVDLPVRNSRGPLLTVDAPPGDHGLPALYHEESGAYTRPNRDGTWFVGHYPGEHGDAATIDPDDVGDAVAADRRRACLDAVDDLAPGLADGAVHDEWVGVRTLTPDGDPIAGGTAVDGLAVAAFNANGVQYAPAAGRILASVLGGVDPAFTPGALALGRFE
jgi:sarcosine oxidase subunit beta